MKWAIKFLLRLLFRDDAGFYDLRKEILNKSIEKDNKSKVTIMEKVYDPPYEFEIEMECDQNKNVVYKLEFSASTPYEVCSHECECGVKMNFTATMSTRKEMSWKEFGLTSKNNDFYLGMPVYHKFEITKACEKSKEIKVNQNAKSI